MQLAAEHSQPAPPVLSDRARAIIAGLIATGRAARMSAVAADLIVLRKLTAPGHFYWVTIDGEVRAGSCFAVSEDLQPGFIASMARLGGARA